MSERRRNLSGFGGVPKPPRPAEPTPGSSSAPSPPSPAGSPQSRTGSRPKTRLRTTPSPSERSSKKRITLSLPVDIAAALKQRSEQTGRYYLDLILDAFIQGRAEIQADVDSALASTELGLRPLRRRAAPGRVQVALLIPGSDLESLDEAATAARLDRSGYVAELLDRSGSR